MASELIGNGGIGPTLGSQLPDTNQRGEVEWVTAYWHARRLPGGRRSIRRFGILRWQIAEGHIAVMVAVASAVLFAVNGALGQLAHVRRVHLRIYGECDIKAVLLDLIHDSLRVVTESSAFTIVYHVTGQISLADPLGRATSWRDASECIAITLPDGISSHQGGAQDGETVTYTIYYNQTANIDVVGSASTGVAVRVTRVIGAGALLTLTIILAVLGFRFFRRPFGNKQVK